MADVGLDELSGETGEPCAELEHMTDAMVLKAALEILKKMNGRSCFLHASAGLKHREVAAGLGLPLATVLSKYNRHEKMQNYLREGSECR